MKGEELLIMIGLILCGGQAYAWYHFSQFRTIVTLHIIGIIAAHTEEVGQLKEDVTKLKNQLKQYESGQEQSK